VSGCEKGLFAKLVEQSESLQFVLHDFGPGFRLGLPNAELFNDCALDAVAKAPAPVEWLLVAAEPRDKR
jgi:hypothetical protein